MKMEIKQQREFIDNIDFSETWLIKEICKLHDEQNKSGKVQYLKIKKIDLLKLVQKFIKLNEKGE